MSSRHMNVAEAKRLYALASEAERMLAKNLEAAQRLVILTKNATRADSTTTELGIRFRNEETITSILDTVNRFRQVSREAERIFARGTRPEHEVTSTETGDPART